jgi:hypothetical protein
VAQTSLWRLSLLATFLWILAGCGGPMSEADYGKAYQTECEKYFAAMKKMNETPWPKITGRTKEERYKILSQRAQEDGKVVEGLASDFRKLKPPPSYAALHSAYQEFLDGQVRCNEAYANAIAAGNSAEATKQNQAYVDFVLMQIEVVLKESEKLGVDVSKLRKGLAGLDKVKL